MDRDPTTGHPLRRSTDFSQLEYLQKREAKRTMFARAVLLSVIFAMMAGNLWMTERNHEALLINMDQARLAQVTLDEQSEARVAALEARIVELQASVDEDSEAVALALVR